MNNGVLIPFTDYFSKNRLIEANKFEKFESIEIIEVPKVIGSKGLGNEYLTPEQMKSLGWNKIHCAYKVIGTGKDSPMNDMSRDCRGSYGEWN